MNNLNNIPGEIIKTSALPENVPTHLIGVIMGTSPQTVKYSTQALAYSVSQLMTNVVRTDKVYGDPTWIETLSWTKIISTPNTLTGYGITDPVVLTSGSYSDPSWITSLAWSKITGAPSFVTSLAALTDVQLGTLSAGEALVYNGTKWVNQSVGELDTLQTVTTRGNTTTNSITVNGITSPYYQLNTTATPTLQVGMFRWNDSYGVPEVRLKGNNVTGQLFLEDLIRVVNKTGADLLEADFRVVRVRSVAEGGAQGQRLAVVLAQADNDTNSATTIGVVTETILNNQEGFINRGGEVNRINTTGAKSWGGLETWVDGDILYLSPDHPGYLTKIKPSAPQHLIVIGWVVYAHANNGKLQIKVDNGYEIDELHNVKITSAANNDLLQYDLSQQVWKNVPATTVVPTYIRKSDFVTDTNYLGVAVSGSSESASVWKIYKIVVSSSGATTKTSATNVAWTDRYTVIYS